LGDELICLGILKKHFFANWQIHVLGLIVIGLFVIPNLFWGHLYMVGGDDARLYYLYPLQYLKNFSFNVMSGNSLGGNFGYLPVSYSVPTIIIILIIKTLFPYLNTQFIMYGIIFSSGFLFFHLFLQECVTKKNLFSFWGSIVASLFYILSLYITRTYFQHQLISIFLLMVLPGCLYFFVSGLKRSNIARIIISSLLYSVFSSTVLSFPWLLPVFVTLIPFFVYLVVRFGRFFWKAIIIFITVTLLCNVYWVIHYIIPVFYKTGETGFTSSLLTAAFKQQNHDLITNLSNLNSPVNQVINFLRTSWQDRQGATFLQSIGIVYLSVILLAGVVIRKVKNETRILYLTATAGLLLAMLFVTPNFGNWNLQLFEFLNDHMPFFGIFRNMYDKFALAMAFNYAFALFVSLLVLEEAKIKKIFRYICLLIVFSLVIVTALPYLHPAYNDTQYSTRISGQLNSDFVHLTEYIRQLNTSERFVWLPMTFPGYVYIGDELNSNHFYTGISPLRIFSRSGDLAGFYGLQTEIDPTLNWTVMDLLKNKAFSEVGKIYQKLNVGYVIVNHEYLPPQESNTLNQFDFINNQNNEYKRAILGTKIRDFGNRYSLYAINETFKGTTVFLTDSVTTFRVASRPVSFHKDSNAEYDVFLKDLSKPMILVVLEPYNSLWKLRLVTNGRVQNINTAHMTAYRYGNAWQITPGDIATKYPEFIVRQPDGNYTLHLQIYFWPNKFIIPSIILSILSFAAAVLFSVVSFVRVKRKGKTDI